MLSRCCVVWGYFLRGRMLKLFRFCKKHNFLTMMHVDGVFAEVCWGSACWSILHSF